MKIYYGNETEKALKSFGRAQTPSPLIRAYGEVKKAALMAQQDFEKRYPQEYFAVLMDVCSEIISGLHDEQFPLSLRQGGAGTSLHMNICEVISNMANDRYQGIYKSGPLEDIACYQSTNDTFPSAAVIMLYRFLCDVEKKIIELQEFLVKSEKEHEDVLLTARTELQDALPIKLSQVFSGWAGSVERDRWRLSKLKERIRVTALGGTAVGTCFSAPAAYVFAAEKYLREVTSLPLCRSQNLPDAVAHHDCLSELANGFSLAAGNIYKITGDLLLYTSSLCGEMKHPDLQYGSTIMPFKTNPVILEYVRGLAILIQEECSRISRYCSEGQLQLNPYIPFALDAFIDVHSSLLNAVDSLLNRFFSGMKIDRALMLENLYGSKAILNTLRPILGYNMIKELSVLMEGKETLSPEEFINIVASHTDIDRETAAKWLGRDNLTGYRSASAGRGLKKDMENNDDKNS